MLSSTPTQGATDGTCSCGSDAGILIHAPTRGATHIHRFNNLDFLISIHAPAWGATIVVHRLLVFNDHFNPRSRMGSDPCACLPGGRIFDFNPRSRMGSDFRVTREPAAIWISIHAPAWGATFSDAYSTTPSTFQSTLPHGERQQTSIKIYRKNRKHSTIFIFFEACKINYTTKYILVIKKTNILACEPPRDFMITCSSHFK